MKLDIDDLWVVAFDIDGHEMETYIFRCESRPKEIDLADYHYNHIRPDKYKMDVNDVVVTSLKDEKIIENWIDTERERKKFLALIEEKGKQLEDLQKEYHEMKTRFLRYE